MTGARILSAALLCASAVPAQAAAGDGHRWQVYGNARYEYTICFPADLMEARPEADNGDGRVFVAADGTRMEVWGTFNAEDLAPPQVLAREAARIADEGGKVTYRASRPGWYALSGTQDGKVFYQRGLSNSVRFATFSLRYDKALAAKWNAVAARISACLTDGESS